MLRYTTLLICLGIAASTVWSTLRNLLSEGLPSATVMESFQFIVLLLSFAALFFLLLLWKGPQKPQKYIFGSRENILKWQRRGKFKFYAVFIIPISSFYISLFKVLSFSVGLAFPQRYISGAYFVNLYYCIILGSFAGILTCMMLRKSLTNHKLNNVES